MANPVDFHHSFEFTYEHNVLKTTEFKHEKKTNRFDCCEVRGHAKMSKRKKRQRSAGVAGLCNICLWQMDRKKLS